MKPLVERYLGSLPASGGHETWKDVGIRPPAGVVEKRIERGVEPKSQVGIVFTGPFQFDEMHRLVLRTMAETLAGDLQAILREELGGTYGVSVEPQSAKFPTEQYSIAITFSCDPARAEDLSKAVFQQIERFKMDGPGQEQVADARATRVRELETNSRDNGYLLNQLLFKYQYGEDIKDVLTIQDRYRALTPSMLRDAARQYLTTDRYVKVTLFPEKK